MDSLVRYGNEVYILDAIDESRGQTPFKSASICGKTILHFSAFLYEVPNDPKLEYALNSYNLKCEMPNDNLGFVYINGDQKDDQSTITMLAKEVLILAKNYRPQDDLYFIDHTRDTRGIIIAEI